MRGCTDWREIFKEKFHNDKSMLATHTPCWILASIAYCSQHSDTKLQYAMALTKFQSDDKATYKYCFQLGRMQNDYARIPMSPSPFPYIYSIYMYVPGSLQGGGSMRQGGTGRTMWILDGKNSLLRDRVLTSLAPLRMGGVKSSFIRFSLEWRWLETWGELLGYSKDGKIRERDCSEPCDYQTFG